ncbi:hypothetical protein [Candidatus Amarobacter glycogenicus]|uniref:hypothetical protein n=1 Tax=Candidatus Amarobacter glycogenicus TaxID=3140699 RepID=UPI0031CC891D
MASADDEGLHGFSGADGHEDLASVGPFGRDPDAHAAAGAALFDFVLADFLELGCSSDKRGGTGAHGAAATDVAFPIEGAVRDEGGDRAGASAEDEQDRHDAQEDAHDVDIVSLERATRPSRRRLAFLAVPLIEPCRGGVWFEPVGQ